MGHLFPSAWKSELERARRKKLLLNSAQPALGHHAAPDGEAIEGGGRTGFVAPAVLLKRLSDHTVTAKSVFAFFGFSRV